MAMGRLFGDRLTVVLGARRLVLGGAALAALGFGIALASGDPATAIAGVIATGLGLAAIFPVTLRAAAAQTDPPAPAIAAVSGLGYTAFLLGPPLIGGLAELSSLRGALVLVVVVCVAAAALGRTVTAAVRAV
jgi:MFS family permease